MLELTNLLLLAGEAVIYFVALGALLRARKRIGLGAFFCALGVMHFLETYLASTLYVPLPLGIVASPGSTVLFTGKLMMLLLLYIREDAVVVRQPIYGLLFGNVLLFALGFVMRAVSEEEDAAGREYALHFEEHRFDVHELRQHLERHHEAHGSVAERQVQGVAGDSHAALFANAGWRPGRTKVSYGTGTSVMATTAADRAGAVHRAAAARRVRREIGEAMKAGRLDLLDALDRSASDADLAAMRVGVLLGWLPGHGPVRVDAALRRIRAAPDRRRASP